ncbi:hypothetical protein K8I61_18725 [bacterium]|nr:hypothetical protein [bacterium]
MRYRFILFLALAIAALLGMPKTGPAEVGADTEATEDAPVCLDAGVEQLFEATVTFHSPDGEGMKGAQIWIGDTWEFGDVFAPAAGSIPGAWSVQVNPAGNVVEWEFTRENDEPGGGLVDGESVTFTFEATAGDPGENVDLYVFGDVAAPAVPHERMIPLGWDVCAGDDDTGDDDTGDDDSADDDTGDDDTGDDDTGDDDSADDDSADDDMDDDFDDDASDDDFDDDMDDDTDDDDFNDDDTGPDDDDADDDDENGDPSNIDPDERGDDEGDSGGCGSC